MSDFPIGIKKAATLVILRNDNHFLLLKRLKEPNKDTYTPVGGKLEPYENPTECAVRETREETGIILNNIHYCGTLVESSPTKYNWISFVYLSQIPHQPPPYSNEGSLEWISFDQLLSVPTPKTDWFIYKYVMDNKPFAFNANFDEALNMLNMKEEIEGIWLVN